MHGRSSMSHRINVVRRRPGNMAVHLRGVIGWHANCIQVCRVECAPAFGNDWEDFVRLFFILDPAPVNPVLTDVLETLRQRGIHVESGVAEEYLCRSDQSAPAYDLFILESHTELALSVAAVLHEQGAPLLNPYPGCLAVRNKILAAHILSRANISTPNSWVTSDFRLLRTLVNRMPLIIKSYMGWPSESFRVVRCADDLANLRPPQTPVLIQEYFEAPTDRLEIYVAGEHAFAVRKSSLSTGISAGIENVSLTPELRGIAACCGVAFNLSLFGVDLVVCATGPKVVGMSHFPSYAGVQAAGVLADYIEGYATGFYRLSEDEISVDAKKAASPAPVENAPAKMHRGPSRQIGESP